MARTLIKGGWVVSMDDKIGDIRGGDVLIEDDRIVAVDRDIDAGDAEVIDASNMIVSPGMINTHEHTWQTGVRGVVADWTLSKGAIVSSIPTLAFASRVLFCIPKVVFNLFSNACAGR